MLTDVSQILVELAAVPVRVQESMDRAWLEDISRLHAWKHSVPEPEGAKLLREQPPLDKAVTPERPLVAQYELSVMLRLEIERTIGFRIMAEPLNATWAALFGEKSEAPQLGYEIKRGRRTAKETFIQVSIVQTPLPTPAGGAEQTT